MENAYLLGRFEAAAGFLPEHLRGKVNALPLRAKLQAEEFRLRLERPLFVTYSWGEEAISGTKITENDLETVLNIVSGSSVHTVLDQLKRGFVALRGGHRLGVCGTAVMERGEIGTLKDFSSLCLRIAKEYRNVATPVIPMVCRDGEMLNTLILSAPGGGKTTLLRDMIRRLSNGENCVTKRVGLVDERGEIAGILNGRATLDVGARTDVMDRVSKGKGIQFLLKGLNPQLIALDEVTEEEDLEGMKQAVGCGVTLLATAHAGDFRDFTRRKLYKNLLNEEIFERFVLISNLGGKREYHVLNGAGERLC